MRVAGIFIAVLSILPFTLPAQNMLANGSFEDENICTEYIKNCAPEAWIATSLISNYYFDHAQWAQSGTHFLGIITGHLRTPLMRNFVCSRLLCGMRKGNKYRVEFFLRSRHDVLDSIGIYFSDNNFLYEKRNFRQLTPQLILRDTQTKMSSEWQKFSLIYTATGEENFIAIGSFKKTDYKFRDKADDGWHYFFYLDDIRIIPENPNEMICPDAATIKSLLYSEDERHSLLDKKRYLYTRTPPVVKRPQVTVIKKIDTLIIPDILFSSASYTLRPQSHQLLDDFYNQIHSRAIDSLIAEGHTDSIGSVTYNEKLSLNRAKTVADYIIQKFPAFSKPVQTRGFASQRPVATNSTSQGRQKNRRVELYLYSTE
ncbi:MAG TPA: OmpA family protein [Flavitalea sp.]|nr:OmpA family protein [Flavitalea sp.]